CETSSRELGATSYSRFSAASDRVLMSSRRSTPLCAGGTVVVQAAKASTAVAVAMAVKRRKGVASVLVFMGVSRIECGVHIPMHRMVSVLSGWFVCVSSNQPDRRLASVVPDGLEACARNALFLSCRGR